MAYSNINKDKKQVEWVNFLKKAGIAIISAIVIISSVSSIWQQWTTLKEAERRNKELEVKVNQISRENQLLSKQIEYATSSAAQARAFREVLGLGTSGDVWLKLPPEQPGRPSLAVSNAAPEEKPNVLKWWELFNK